LATYAYTILEPTGHRKTGFVDAKTREGAVAQLTAGGNYLIDIDERAAREGFSKAKAEKKAGGKPSKADLAMFSRRMADLADAGLPLDRVLQVVSEQSESLVLTEISEEVLKDVRGGSSVSDALAKHPKYFPSVFTSTLKAGEQSGQFGEVAARLADFQENEVARKSQVVSALIYPAILLVVALGVVFFILTFVIPKLSGTFAAQGDNLPSTTKLLLDMSDFLQKDWMIIVGSIAGIVIAYRLWVATPSGAYTRDGILLRLPVVGKIAVKGTVSRFARVLGTLLFGGVAILDAIELSGIASGNRVFQKSSEQVRSDVREGKPIAVAMRDAGAFPPVLTHMVAVGEETGDLPHMLKRVSDSLDFEVDNGLRRATALVEPIIIIVMGGFVAFVVISVLLPILNSSSAVK
jgi:type II secretory pathway component PulF